MKFKCGKYRTFPHSNSKRKQIDRDKEDREEALEYTTEYPQLRNGGIHGGSCPDAYDDVMVYHKYESKPKKNDHHRDRKAIRKIKEESEEVRMNHDDDLWEDYDRCYECTGYGDDYGYDDDGELVCNCDDCLFNPVWNDDDEID